MTFLERRVPDVTGEVLARHRFMVDIVPTEEKAKIIEVLSADKLRKAFKGVFHWAGSDVLETALASASRETPGIDRSPALSTKTSQCSGGIEARLRIAFAVP